MSKVVREDIDNLNAVLTVTLEKEDYEPQYLAELGKYRKQAHMKGFRRGKTPMSVVKKMYGKSVLGDVINQLLQEALNKHLTEEKLEILGQPIPAASQEPVDFDLKNLEDYEFTFDLGLAPKFEVAGVSKDNTFEIYKVDITDEMIDEDMDAVRKRSGKRTNPENDIQGNDFLKLEGTELEDGQPKEGGLVHEFSVLVDRLTDEVKTEVLKKKLGDRFAGNIFELEKDAKEGYVRKQLLGLEDDDDREVNPTFEFEVTEVSRVEAAELNQEFFDQYFGAGEVSSEEEARQKVKESIQQYYDNQADALLFRDFQEDLMEKNPLDFPKDFLKRWMLVANENATEEMVEDEYDSFATNLQWTLIRSKLIEKFELEVTEEELRGGFANQIMSYLGNSPYASEDFIASMVERSLQDENSVRRMYDELMTDKLHEAIKGEVTTKEKAIDVEAFRKIAQEAREKAEAERGGAVVTGEEE